MDISPKLAKWVATEAHEPARLIEPTHVDAVAREELSAYLPAFVASREYTMHLEAGGVVNGEQFAVLKLPETHWPQEMVEVAGMLRLFPMGEGDSVYLSDAAIGTPENQARQPEMNGWVITKWEVHERAEQSSPAGRVNIDTLHWLKVKQGRGSVELGTEAISSFEWLPYPERPQS